MGDRRESYGGGVPIDGLPVGVQRQPHRRRCGAHDRPVPGALSGALRYPPRPIAPPAGIVKRLARGDPDVLGRPVFGPADEPVVDERLVDPARLQ